MVNLVIFLIGSLGLITLSRHSLTKPHSHGFPRFFSFEAILSLVTLNAPEWFVNPFSLPQLMSWALLLVSIFLAVYSFWILRRFGQPDQSIQDPNRLSFEKTTQLVTKGPYRFIRHPLYASLLCLSWGVFLKQISILFGMLVTLSSLALFITAIFEEKENLHIFGKEYVTYCNRTKRFIPFLF